MSAKEAINDKFRRNFRPTRIEATKIFVGLQVFLVTISKDGLHMLRI